MSEPISRRKALAGAAAGLLLGSSADGAQALQTRVLGRTGIRTTIVGMGCGEAWWKFCKEEAVAQKTLELALDSGIRYFDTGQTYGKGISETWVGATLGDRRKEITLATKISTRDGDEAMRETERCLKRLKTDHLDVLHIHNLRKEDDLVTIEKKGGLLQALYRMRDQKIARFVGITSHTDPVTLKTALERHDFDCTQMALNAAMQGHYEGFTSRPGHSFESIALPVAKRKNMGILAMKTTGRDQLVGSEPGKAVGRDLIRYALSLPISVAVVGMGQLQHVHDNVELARTFAPFDKREMNTLAERVAAQRAALHGFIRNHDDA
jgi:aryl-alcohol dehydrogenase-like predicted oxidoreductase